MSFLLLSKFVKKLRCLLYTSLDGSKVKAALPIFDVLTLSATGTEMDPFAVISDMSKNEK